MVQRKPEVGSIYRTLGRRSAWERVGCGVMDKSGFHGRGDHSDYLAPTYSVVWVLAGRGRYRDETGLVRDFSAGDCFHRWPGRRHSTLPVDTGGWFECFVDCGPGLHTALADTHVLRPDAPVWTPASAPVDQICDLRRALEQATESALGPLVIQALGLITHARVGSEQDQTGDLIDTACGLLAEEALGRGDLRQWCRARGVGYEWFRKAFAQRMGEPPGQYRIRRRMERACALLLSSDRPIGELASMLGYASPYEFSAQFSRRFGVSPSSYRSQRP